MKTVALAAGVSVSTVSNAYNRPGQLSVAVRERVLGVAARLGYPGPHPGASSLRSSRRSGSIGVLFAADLAAAVADPCSIELLHGVAEIAAAEETNVVLMPICAPSGTLGGGPQDELDLVPTVRRASVDGVVAVDVAPDHVALRVLGARGVQVVGSRPGVGDRTVSVDDRSAATQVGVHLRGLGHRRVVVVAHTLDDRPAGDGDGDARRLRRCARERVDGLRVGLGVESDVVLLTGSGSRASGHAACCTALSLRPRPSAIVATTDVLALGVIDRLREGGESGIAVTGFGDVDEAGAVGLTTVRRPSRDQGRLLARALLDPDAGRRPVVLPAELVVRTSSTAVPAHLN